MTALTVRELATLRAHRLPCPCGCGTPISADVFLCRFAWQRVPGRIRARIAYWWTWRLLAPETRGFVIAHEHWKAEALRAIGAGGAL